MGFVDLVVRPHAVFMGSCVLRGLPKTASMYVLMSPSVHPCHKSLSVDVYRCTFVLWWHGIERLKLGL